MHIRGEGVNWMQENKNKFWVGSPLPYEEGQGEGKYPQRLTGAPLAT